MITIFQGRKLSLDGTKDEIYAQIAVTLRDKIHLFNTGRSINSFGIFICLALHVDMNGWAFPSRSLLMKETGFVSEETIGRSLKHLRGIEIDGHHFLEMYRQYNPETKRWGKTVYRIFPGGFKDGFASAPFPNLVVWNPETKTGPPPHKPRVDEPEVECGGVMKNPHLKENHSKENQTTTTAPKVVVVEKFPSVPAPSSLSGKAVQEEESTPGFCITRSDDVPRILTLTPHPRAYKLECTDCGAESDWQASDSGRRKHSLICQECGAHFIVKTESPKSGVKHTYSKPVARASTSSWVQIDDAPKGFQSFKASEADAQLLLSTWKERKVAVLEGLKWMAGKKSPAKWGSGLASALIAVMQTNGIRDNAWGSKRAPPSKRPPPRAETDWNAVIDEVALTNADLFAEEEE